MENVCNNGDNMRGKEYAPRWMEFPQRFCGPVCDEGRDENVTHDERVKLPTTHLTIFVDSDIYIIG